MSFIRFIFSGMAFIVGVILVIPAVLAMLPFWLLETIIKIPLWKPRISAWEDIIRFDPTLGWRVKPDVKTWMETDGRYRVTIGSDGWRGNYSLKDCDTIVIGDSFVFGQGADDQNYFANQTRISRVKPIGAPGYGATHYLLLLKNLESELKGKLVVWFVFTGNDYREAIRPTSYGYRFPFVFYDNEIKSYHVRTNNIKPEKLPFNFEKGYKTSVPELADLYYKNYLSDYAFGAFEYLVKEAKDHCEKHGAKFTVATTPLCWLFDEKTDGKIKRHCSNEEKFSARYPDEQAAKTCERLDIPFCAGSDRFVRKDFLPNDFHWSRAGNQKAAAIIDELYASFLESKTK